MAKILRFDNSIETKLKRAREMYDDECYYGALPLLRDVINIDESNDDAWLLIAQIYAEMTAFDESNEAYMNLIAIDQNKVAVKGLISNLMVLGDFKMAKYYADTFNVDFDFSNFLTVQTDDGETIFGGDDDDEDEPRNFRIIVDRKEKGAENRIKEKPIEDMTVGDITSFMSSDGTLNFNELMEKLLTIGEDDDICGKRRTEMGFKQVYPIPSSECEKLIADSFNLFSSGKAEKALELLSKISEKNGKYYYIAEKNKVLCYLSLNRFASMRASAEIALKGLSDDYTLKCYYYISLKLLEENKEADKVFNEIKDKKPTSSMEYMVKLDACRLQLDHEGVLECVEHILLEYPYQRQLLLLHAKAQYNVGLVDASRVSFLEILKYFPDEYEAILMLEKINAQDNGEMAYGEIELQIERVHITGEIKFLLQNGTEFINYLKTDKGAIKNIEFVLLNESDRTVYSVVSALKNYMSKDIQKLFRRLLISQKASNYLKTLIISTLLSETYPRKIAVAVGNRLKLVDMPDYSWDKGMSEVFVQTADVVFAQFIMTENNPKKRVLALINRLQRISKYISNPSDKETFDEINGITDAVALKKALTDLTIHKVSRATPMTLTDENYKKIIEILERIDEDYEI